MAKKKHGSVKLTDTVAISPVDLTTAAAEVTGVLPVASGGTGLGAAGSNGDVLTTVGGVPAWQAPAAAVVAGAASGTWGAPAAESGNKIDVTLQLKDSANANLAAATAEVEVMVSDSATDAEPSATATLTAATTPLGTLLAGSGTATAIWRCTSSGQIAVGVNEAAAASRFLWIRQGKNSQWYIRATAAPLQVTFA